MNKLRLRDKTRRDNALDTTCALMKQSLYIFSKLQFLRFGIKFSAADQYLY